MRGGDGNVCVRLEYCASPLCPFDPLPSPKIEGNECGANYRTANAPSPAAHRNRSLFPGHRIIGDGRNPQHHKRALLDVVLVLDNRGGPATVMSTVPGPVSMCIPLHYLHCAPQAPQESRSHRQIHILSYPILLHIAPKGQIRCGQDDIKRLIIFWGG